MVNKNKQPTNNSEYKSPKQKRVEAEERIAAREAGKSEPKEPNYKARRAVGGAALAILLMGGGKLGIDAVNEHSSKELGPDQSNSLVFDEDIESVTIPDGTALRSENGRNPNNAQEGLLDVLDLGSTVNHITVETPEGATINSDSKGDNGTYIGIRVEDFENSGLDTSNLGDVDRDKDGIIHVSGSYAETHRDASE